MRHVKFMFKNESYTLLYNAMAMLEMQEKFGSDTDIIKKIKEKNVEGFKTECEILEILSTQSANVKSILGYDRPKIITAEYLMSFSSLIDIYKWQMVIISAMNAGLEREIEDDSDIDLGLLELQKKKEPKK